MARRAFKDILLEPLSGGVWGIVLLVVSLNAGIFSAILARSLPALFREAVAAVSGTLILLALWTLWRYARGHRGVALTVCSKGYTASN